MEQPQLWEAGEGNESWMGEPTHCAQVLLNPRPPFSTAPVPAWPLLAPHMASQASPGIWGAKDTYVIAKNGTRKQVVTKIRKMSSGNQSYVILIARITGIQLHNLNQTLLDKMQLRALQGARLDCSGLVYGY